MITATTAAVGVEVAEMNDDEGDNVDRVVDETRGVRADGLLETFVL